MIHMLKDFDKEDLETLWKLVKAKHGSTRPEEGYTRVLWEDLMTMFESDVESPVWRTLQNEKVLIWKLFDSCGVHFLRLQSMHLFMLVEKRYPLTPTTITEMLNKKIQIDHLNEMCYQLLKLMTKQLKNPESLEEVIVKVLGFQSDDLKITVFDLKDVIVGRYVAFEIDLEIDNQVLPLKLLDDVHKWQHVDLPIL
ncbi:hypothetical protein Tco_0534104 [Tanacetum coccineum]